jgi:hypothetical protein
VRINILGGGLFGRIIGLFLAEEHSVTIIDRSPPEEASRLSGFSAAGCVMKPGWLSSVPNLSEVLKELDRLVGTTEMEFDVFGKGRSWASCTVLHKHRLMMADTFRDAGIRWVRGEITQADGPLAWVKLEPPEHAAPVPLRSDVTVDCRGIWSPIPEVRARWGVALNATTRPGQVRPTIKPWRPYTQLVQFEWPDRPGRAWGGDGTALLNWTDESTRATRSRVASFMGLDYEGLTESLGARPYLGPQLRFDGPCLLWEVRPGYWHANGGAKNGTAGAGWAGLELRKALRRSSVPTGATT